MKTLSISGFKSFLRNLKSGIILNKIGSGKGVFFENPLEGTVFKYIPGEIGRISKYYVKHCGENEYEIDSDSRSIIKALLEGRPISKSKYDNYHSMKIFCNFRIIKTPVTSKAVGV